jgi:hypothetical protein
LAIGYCWPTAKQGATDPTKMFKTSAYQTKETTNQQKHKPNTYMATARYQHKNSGQSEACYY